MKNIPFMSHPVRRDTMRVLWRHIQRILGETVRLSSQVLRTKRIICQSESFMQKKDYSGSIAPSRLQRISSIIYFSISPQHFLIHIQLQYMFPIHIRVHLSKAVDIFLIILQRKASYYIILL